MSFARVVVVSLGGSLPNVLLQVGALIGLSAFQYGQFAITYLVYAWFSSLSLSLIGEPWLRSKAAGRNESWSAYVSVTIALAVMGALVGMSVGWLVLTPVAAIFAGLAILFATFRQNIRFRLLASRRFGRVLAADLISSIVLCCMFLPAVKGVTGLVAIWATSGVVASLVLLKSGFGKFVSPAGWIRRHRSSITTLLADSILLDIGVIGVPALLAPYMGPERFGIYRAVSSVALPARLALNSARPVLGSMPRSRISSFPSALIVFSVGLLIASGVGGGLWLVGEHPVLAASALGALRDYTVPVIVFIAFYFVEMFYQVAARVRGSRRFLVRLRLLQLVYMSMGPLSGWLVFGLPGAIWGMSVAMVAQAATALFAVNFVMREDPS